MGVINPDRLYEILGQVSNVELTSPIKRSDNLVEIGVNSINLIKAVVLIEQEYEVIFRDEDMINREFSTVNDIYNYLVDLKG